MQCRRRRDRAGLAAAADPEAVAALDFAARPHPRPSRAAAAAGRPLHRPARRRARLALDGDRSGRPLRAGRHGELSELGADERRAGQGRRRRAHRHGGAGAGRRASIRWCWSRPSSPACREIYRVGGAQAIAALAYGTETIAPVAKIVGPGNAYVAAAKRQVFGTVGIDMIAGPSEVLVVADAGNDPDWIAADLLAQAEHDAAAQAILITDDAGLRRSRRSGGRAPACRRCRAPRSRRRAGAISAPSSWSRRSTRPLPLVDRIAAEHLELAVADPEPLLTKIRNAGAVFLGRHTPEVIGDYVGGSNHVLPTARSARFSSGLSVLDFVKRTSILSSSAPEQLRGAGAGCHRARQAEGLDAHAPLRRHPAEPVGRDDGRRHAEPAPADRRRAR